MQVKEDKTSTDGENHGDVVTKLLYQNSKKGPKQIQVPSAQQELQLQIMEGMRNGTRKDMIWMVILGRKEGQQLYDNNNNNDDTVVREKLLVDAPPPPISPLICPPLCYNYNRGYSCGYDY